MSIFKKFFSRKKEEAAFKLKLGAGLGQGHTLLAQNSEASSSKRKPVSDLYAPPKREVLSEEAKAAAAAALSRVEKTTTSKEFNTSLAFIKAQAKKELEAESKIKDTSSMNTITENIPNLNLACQGVYFRCPIINEEILPKAEWKTKIKDFLYDQPEGEKALSSCLIIQNCNSKEKAEDCTKTLTKYLENILNFPEEEKYYKIRMSNRIFCEKVRYVEGALDFLSAAGFYEVDIDNEKFLLWSKENDEKSYDLITLIEALQTSEPISLVLDRNIKVLLPSQAKRVELPHDFYRISPEEIKREQQLRSAAAEDITILKTKAMREREEQRSKKIYKYSLVRVKFPNGLFVQGTFGVYEKLSDVFSFVQSCLQDEELGFQLAMSNEGNFSEEDMDKTLYDLSLVPNNLLLFNVTNDGSSYSDPDTNFIKEDLLLLQST